MTIEGKVAAPLVLPAPVAVHSAVLQRKCACGGSSGASGSSGSSGPTGECPECKKKKALQRHATGSAQSVFAPPIVHDVLRSPGQPLDAATRGFFEPRFGHDFSKVRLHTGGRAAESAKAVSALAYTVGHDIVFGAGQYQPNCADGRRLLGHELTHVVQQHGQGATPHRLTVGPSDDALEREANRASGNLQSGNETWIARATGSGSVSVQRACDPDKQADKMSACIEQVTIADDDGKNPTRATSVASAQAIWGKCCIDLTVSAGKTVNKSSFKTLDESTTGTPTAQESSLFAAAGSSPCILVFTPQLFSQGGKTGKDISGGGSTYDLGTANPKIVLVEGAVGQNLAHEIGHALGYPIHDSNPTVMKGTGHYNIPNPSVVSADLCSAVRKGAALTQKGSAKDCCMNYCGLPGMFCTFSN